MTNCWARFIRNWVIEDMTHYARLGVAADASTEEIRNAYRHLARRYHPDRIGANSSPEMLEINEAWRVLSDPVLRRDYDLTLRDTSPRSGATTGSESSITSHITYSTPGPARFPWRFVLGFFIVVATAIVVLGAFTDAGERTPIDNIIRVGSCVDLDPDRQEAWEVSCDGPFDAEVQSMVPFDASCPSGTATYRDRQGLGLVCVSAP